MHLKINDKDYPLSWGMGCFEMFCDTLDCDMEGLDKVLQPGREQIKYMCTLVHCALKNGSNVESIYDDFEISYRDCQKAMSDLSVEDNKKLWDDFRASKYFGKTIAEYLQEQVEQVPADEAPGVKKKSRSAKS